MFSLLSTSTRTTLAALLFGALGAAGVVTACSTSPSSNQNTVCTPGAQVSCACVGGVMGAQVCSADGKSYGMCQCAMGDDGGAKDASGGNDAGMDTGGGNDGSLDSGQDVAVDACASKAVFASVGMQMGSLWSYKAMVGLAAGNLMCQDMGADHVCDYDDLVAAAAKGELSSLTATDTAWLQRTDAVTVNNVTYQPGPGARCSDWNYATDHINDGEFVSFENGGNTPNYHFDDNPNQVQPLPKTIPCGHNQLLRDVLCCYAKCP